MPILPIAIVPDISLAEIAANLGHEDSENATEKSQGPSGPFETALVVPCHDTDHGAMRTTIDSAMPHFRPKDIYIVDIGKTRYPKHPEGNFRSYIRSIHPDILYIWSPIGSKNATQLVGALAARDRGYKYIMTVDDDVCIPKNHSAPIEMINDKFKAVACPIKVMDAQCNVPLWLVAWQDVEYRLSPTIQQMLKNNDERCFWLDPRFCTNPAWLADDSEAKERGEQPEIRSGKYAIPSESTIEAPQPIYQRPLRHSSTESLSSRSGQSSRSISQMSVVNSFRDPDGITHLPLLPPSPLPPSPYFYSCATKPPRHATDTRLIIVTTLINTLLCCPESSYFDNCETKSTPTDPRTWIPTKSQLYDTLNTASREGSEGPIDEVEEDRNDEITDVENTS